MTNHPNGTLYIGVTNDLHRRISKHRTGTGSRFAKRYYLKRLVYAERMKISATPFSARQA